MSKTAVFSPAVRVVGGIIVSQCTKNGAGAGLITAYPGRESQRRLYRLPPIEKIGYTIIRRYGSRGGRHLTPPSSDKDAENIFFAFCRKKDLRPMLRPSKTGRPAFPQSRGTMHRAPTGFTYPLLASYYPFHAFPFVVHLRCGLSKKNGV